MSEMRLYRSVLRDLSEKMAGVGGLGIRLAALAVDGQERGWVVESGGFRGKEGGGGLIGR